MDSKLFLLIAGSCLLLLVLLCCVCSRQDVESEKYMIPNPNSLEGDASLLQKSFLPPADELEELGGSYAIEAGIQSPKVSTEQDPWL